MLLFTLACASPAPAPTVASRFDARYGHYTLWQTIEDHAAMGATSDLAIVGRDVPIRVRVTFLGGPRPIHEQRRRVIAAWAREFGLDSAPADFQHEIEVQEREQRYWLPIQRTLAGDLARAHAPGSTLELYAMYLGAIRPAERAETSPVFIVNGYRALR